MSLIFKLLKREKIEDQSDQGLYCLPLYCVCLFDVSDRKGRTYKAIFFNFLVYGSSDPTICILEKKLKFYI